MPGGAALTRPTGRGKIIQYQPIVMPGGAALTRPTSRGKIVQYQPIVMPVGAALTRPTGRMMAYTVNNECRPVQAPAPPGKGAPGP
ncbi:hypothetical protein CHU32_20580 [Superficieibacter electus]|uniref:Uncharacterized protein n=1 Tax=Superficieibacter electus TaxID=2022662 RepID=A0A2P5GK80_9ENTR|nr:hypothetical protein CHU33_16660 [Superficieibacter electus]POP44744.1 hypothetical protein CHU32_20580 [Superficieibacter electus]